MMMSGDKKKMAAIIVSKMTPARDMNRDAFLDRAKEPEKPHVDEGILSASEEMIQAIHSRDAQGFATALQDFLEMNEGSEKADASEPEPTAG